MIKKFKMYVAKILKKSYNTLYKRVCYTLFLSVLFLSPVISKAQLPVPVDAAFFGNWTFDHAKAQERPENSQQGYTTRSVSQDEFWQKPYLLNVPTRITFMDGFMTHISHPSWSKPALAAINPMNKGMLEFRDFHENSENYNNKIPTPSEIDSYPVIMPSYSLTLNNGMMSLQCNYTYHDAQGNYIEEILTVYYNKKCNCLAPNLHQQNICKFRHCPKYI